MPTVTRTLKTLALPVLLILSLIGFDRLLAPPPPAYGLPVEVVRP